MNLDGIASPTDRRGAGFRTGSGRRLAPLPFRGLPALPALRFRGLPALPALLLAALVAGCGEREDWSPIDGPWDPEHPEAAQILAAPDPDEPIDREMAAAGERWYRARGCLACHALEGDEVVGPPMAGVTERREYEWFRGMVMRPDSMLRVDPVAQEMLRMYRLPMPNQGVDELRTRAMWEYLRARDAERRDSAS